MVRHARILRSPLVGLQLRSWSCGHGTPRASTQAVTSRPITTSCSSYRKTHTSTSSLASTRSLNRSSTQPSPAQQGHSSCFSTRSPYRQQTSSRAMSEPKITPLRESDFEAWAALFKAYINFYKSTIPEEQYAKTFARILDPNKDLYGLVMRDADDESKLIGIAHFYPHQSPWGEKPRMHFNDLFIDPNVRAKGYGRKMIMAVAEESKKKDCYMLEWATQHGNVTARKLYDQLAKCDFVEYRMMLE